MCPHRSADRAAEGDWDRTIAGDLKGVFLALKSEVAHMVANGGEAIVNTASIAGVIADPGMAPYVAAKHGVIGSPKQPHSTTPPSASASTHSHPDSSPPA